MKKSMKNISLFVGWICLGLSMQAITYITQSYSFHIAGIWPTSWNIHASSIKELKELGPMSFMMSNRDLVGLYAREISNTNPNILNQEWKTEWSYQFNKASDYANLIIAPYKKQVSFSTSKKIDIIQYTVDTSQCTEDMFNTFLNNNENDEMVAYFRKTLQKRWRTQEYWKALEKKPYLHPCSFASPVYAYPLVSTDSTYIYKTDNKYFNNDQYTHNTDKLYNIFFIENNDFTDSDKTQITRKIN